jgi:subtilisin family serine protease
MAGRRLAKASAKLQPKLRVVANGSDEVNAIRAQYASSVKVPEEVAERVPVVRTRRFVAQARAAGRVPAPPRLDTRPQAYVSTFVHLTDDPADWPDDGPLAGETAGKANIRTAQLLVQDAMELADEPWVVSMELGQPLTMPAPAVERGRPSPPPARLRRFGRSAVHRFGKDVLVGLIDVGGFDFSHPEFLDDDGNTRFLRIWDQGGTNRPSPAAFGYGSELTKADHLDRALREASERRLPAYELEPQSQMTPRAHATHVASIAAGARGVARNATLAGVLVSIPPDEAERRLSFYDSSRLAHAVDYLLALGREQGMPVSINISLGTNGHAHDDSSAVNRWIDAALTTPGRSVCVAVGNAGQDRPAYEGDLAYVMGRIHASGRVAARELVADLEWVVVGNTRADVSENELEIWYGPQDRFAVQVKPPGEEWTKPIEPGEFVENRQLSDGMFLSVYNELYNASNGANYIGVYLSPRLTERDPRPVRAGQWLVRLIGRDVRDGRFHAWIERDDPRAVGRIGEREAWSFPSFFSESSFVDASTVSTLACGQRVVAVANLDAEGRRINVTSSQGPTRDGRPKPDIAAPGTAIVAASGFTPGDPWVAMSGTSMASPHVAGVVALMLAANPQLTGAQVAGIIQRSAQPLPGADFAWRDDAGSGALDAERCVQEAVAMRERRELK